MEYGIKVLKTFVQHFERRIIKIRYIYYFSNKQSVLDLFSDVCISLSYM